jgi:hypothetical protein
MANNGSRRTTRRGRMWTSDLRGSKAAHSAPPPPAPTPTAAPAEEPWVTGAQPGAQRVPGIDEAPETRYVDPSVPRPWRPVLIGVGIGLAVTAIVGAIVFTSQSDDEPSAQATAGPATAVTRPPGGRDADGTTTTSTAPATPSTTPSTTVAAATPATSPTTRAPAAAPPPTPRATANPALPPYADRALPAGVTASIGACAWQTANGGQLLASGSVTNAPSTNKPWTLTMHFLQNRRELAQSSVVVPLGAGQSKPWTITTRMPSPPPDLICSLSAS